jgi:hypothetical protein
MNYHVGVGEAQAALTLAVSLFQCNREYFAKFVFFLLLLDIIKHQPVVAFVRLNQWR